MEFCDNDKLNLIDHKLQRSIIMIWIFRSYISWQHHPLVCWAPSVPVQDLTHSNNLESIAT